MSPRARAIKVSKKVHEIRLAGKKARAILKLISPESGPEARRLHQKIRKVSRKLTRARDGVVVIDTIEKLAKGDPKLQKAAPRSIPLPANTELMRMSHELRRIGAEIASLASTEATGPRMRQGLRKTFVRVRKLYAKCREDGSPKKFHEWRRRAKDLLYQIETLAPEPSKREKKWVDCLRGLSESLGEMHDLTLTLEVLGSRRSKVGKLKKRAKKKYSKSARKAVKLARQFFRQGEKSRISATFV